jgi:hypothetical protein
MYDSALLKSAGNISSVTFQPKTTRYDCSPVNIQHAVAEAFWVVRHEGVSTHPRTRRAGRAAPAPHHGRWRAAAAHAGPGTTRRAWRGVATCCVPSGMWAPTAGNVRARVLCCPTAARGCSAALFLRLVGGWFRRDKVLASPSHCPNPA